MPTSQGFHRKALLQKLKKKGEANSAYALLAVE